MIRYKHEVIVDKPEQELQFFINGTEITLKWMLKLLLIIGIPFMISLFIQFFSIM